MFSLQHIFGKADKFFGLLEASGAAHKPLALVAAAFVVARVLNAIGLFNPPGPPPSVNVLNGPAAAHLSPIELETIRSKFSIETTPRRRHFWSGSRRSFARRPNYA